MSRQTLTHPMDPTHMLGGAGDEFLGGHKVTPKVALAKYFGVSRSSLGSDRNLPGCFPIEFGSLLGINQPPSVYILKLLHRLGGLRGVGI